MLNMLRQYYGALTSYSLLKLEKCEFYKREVVFLRYIVGADGVQISKEKIKVVKE
jgi:hypothetical protein